MRVALVGPPQSGKSTLFAAAAQAGGSHVDISRGDQPHLAVVKVPDERLDFLATLYTPKKYTQAELEFLDLPGFDLTDEAGRNRAKAHWAALRQCDMILFVVRSFHNDSVGVYRKGVDPKANVQELLGEMIFADLDQVMSRIEKVQAGLKKPGAKKDEQQRELELMVRLKEALENEKPISSAISSDAEGKLVRSFSFLSQKPMLVVLNCDETDLGEQGEETFEGLPCLKLSAKIEEEIAQLPPAERAEFLADLGIKASARDRMVQACYKHCNLISFLTAGEPEVRAWTIPAGMDAQNAAGTIHTDIARGFIRAETVAFEDLKAAGDMKGAKAAGKVRLEGKTYIVKDGDVMYFRFNV